MLGISMHAISPYLPLGLTNPEAGSTWILTGLQAAASTSSTPAILEGDTTEVGELF